MSELRVLTATEPHIIRLKTRDYDKLVPYPGWCWRKSWNGYTYHELYRYYAQVDPFLDNLVIWLRRRGWVG